MADAQFSHVFAVGSPRQFAEKLGETPPTHPGFPCRVLQTAVQIKPGVQPSEEFREAAPAVAWFVRGPGVFRRGEQAGKEFCGEGKTAQIVDSPFFRGSRGIVRQGGELPQDEQDGLNDGGLTGDADTRGFSGRNQRQALRKAQDVKMERGSRGVPDAMAVSRTHQGDPSGGQTMRGPAAEFHFEASFAMQRCNDFVEGLGSPRHPELAGMDAFQQAESRVPVNRQGGANLAHEGESQGRGDCPICKGFPARVTKTVRSADC